MPILTHTAACRAAQERRERARARWKARWPHACPRCEAQTEGSFPCPGSPRAGRGCLSDLWCPRCGSDDAMHDEDATRPCRFCGWAEAPEGAINPMSCPPEYVCICRVATAAALERDLDRRHAEAQQVDQEIRRLTRLRDRLRS